MAKRFGLAKSERLKSRKEIDRLFTAGSSCNAFPLRALFSFSMAEGTAGVQVGVTVSKRHFKRAVDRNRIKRLLREAYRLQKVSLCDAAREKGQKGTLFILYTDKVIPSMAVIRPAMERCLRVVQKKLYHENPS